MDKKFFIELADEISMPMAIELALANNIPVDTVVEWTGACA